jgi:NhaP-type Na+/H+ or K+/H+ antiporter
MMPSLFFMPTAPQGIQPNEGINFSNPILFILFSLTTGLILGALFGLFQWFSLRKYADKAYKWIIANALGWGLGLGWIYLFASLPTEESSMVFTVLIGICGGLLAGLSVGAITGLFLIRLEKN